MSPIRFSPGQGVAVAGPGHVVLADAPSGPVSTHDVSRLVEQHPGAIAALTVDHGGAMLNVRGPLEVVLDGEPVDVPAGVTTEVRLDGARSLEVAVPGAARTTHDFTVTEGTVPAESIRVDLRPRSLDEAPADPVSSPRGAVRPGVPADAGDDTGDDAGDPFDAMFGHTIVRAVEDAAVRDEPAGADRRDPLGVLIFSTGDRVVVDRPLVLGRNPQSGDAPPDPEARLVKVAGAAVSRRHAAVRLDHWQAFIHDLGSANGTHVTLPGRAPQRIEPGEPVSLVPGATVELGGDVSFVVEEVA
ncbi:MAG: FHA domain-containing protein [Ilumatobacter sp.]|uniref:FHA domain-containing protein n=1 Tax=Ilumatobacter sp. TaxID=1967498 RepID=UPI002609C323|nr:FHA domain-containing protein [Ilumatobacter sp.]MDJ0770269.1 FHA domain-containing protein [Ilumatobacter sp.]